MGRRWEVNRTILYHLRHMSVYAKLKDI
jgi:hypothetical protein